MRIAFLSSALLLTLLACGGETEPPTPTPPVSVPGDSAPSTPAAASKAEPPVSGSPPATAASIPTDLDDPTAAAECAKPWPSVGGTFQSTPENLDPSVQRDVQAQVDGGHITLTFATSSLHVGEHGPTRDENQNVVSFDAPEGETFAPGAWAQTKVTTGGGGSTCWSGGAVGGGYGGFSEDGPKWDLTVTSLTASRIEGSYEMPLPDGTKQHVEFSAPIGDAPLGRSMKVCCLK